MADHGEVEYATATGNDYNEHEGTYEYFIHLTFVGICNVITILIGLTLGGVLGHWATAVSSSCLPPSRPCRAWSPDRVASALR